MTTGEPAELWAAAGAPTSGVDGPEARRAPSLATQLRTGFVSLTAILVLVGFAGLLVAAVARATFGARANRLTGLALANQALLEHLTSADTGARGYGLTGDAAFRERYDDAMAAFGAAVDQVRRQLAEAGDDAAVAAGVDAQVQAAGAWNERYAQPILARREADAEGARLQASSGQGEQLVETFRAANERTTGAIGAARQEAVAEVGAAARAIVVAEAIVLVLGAAVGLVLLRATQRSVVGPLEELRRTLDRLAAGDLSARVPGAGPQEVVAVARAAEELAAQVRSLQATEQRRVQRERTIARFARSVQHLEPAAVLQAAVRSLATALALDRVVIREVVESRDGGRTTGPVAAYYDGAAADSFASARFAADVPREFVAVVDSAFRRRALLAVDDTQHDERLPPSLRAFLAELGVRSLAAVPVVLADETRYVILAQSRTVVRHWTEADLDVLGTAARDLAVALRHAELFAAERAMVTRLQELDQATADFVSSVSHELRTPLASIVGYTELLREGDAGVLNPAQAGMVDVIERNSHRLLDLIDDLLTLSHLEAGSLAFQPAALDAASVIDDVVASLHPSLQDRELQLVVTADPELPPLWADRGQLQRALANVLTNAVKFTPDGGSIRVHTAADDDGAVTFTVTDTGIGIPPGEQEHIFSRFFRSSTARQLAIQGTGLGLAIVRSVVEAHGGTIELRSAPGEGTTVQVRLPATGPAPPRRQPASSTPASG